ncbi:MAG: hypothetical protein KGR42_00250 [Acidobacteria bacterium]|nr:hypothetical protein [Acidobacteriota bacterium]
MTVILEWRQRARGHVNAVMIAWAVVMTVVEVSWELRAGQSASSLLEGALLGALLGAYLGWRRRVGAVFLAPVLNWTIAWLPLWIAAMVRHGLLSGLVVGAVLITVGWILLSALEIAWIGLIALSVRVIRGGSGEPPVTVIPPR